MISAAVLSQIERIFRSRLGWLSLAKVTSRLHFFRSANPVKAQVENCAQSRRRRLIAACETKAQTLAHTCVWAGEYGPERRFMTRELIVSELGSTAIQISSEDRRNAPRMNSPSTRCALVYRFAKSSAQSELPHDIHALKPACLAAARETARYRYLARRRNEC